MLTAETVRELLDYDPVTGSLAWRKPRRGSRGVGKSAGSLEKDGYRRIRISGVQYSAHHVAWCHWHGQWPLSEMDHINGDRSDNAIANLRLATRSENEANIRLPRTNTSGFKGVHFHQQNKKFQATIGTGNRKKHIGYFDTAEEAHAAYCAAAEKFFGEFARFE